MKDSEVEWLLQMLLVHAGLKVVDCPDRPCGDSGSIGGACQTCDGRRKIVERV